MKITSKALFCAIISTYILIACQQKELIQKPRIVKENDTSYLVQDSVLIETGNGGVIHAIIVRNPKVTKPSPTVLFHTIYARKSDLKKAMQAVNHGYVGVISYTRGKGLSPNKVVPYKHEVTDTYDVIDWIGKQNWSNQKVGMYGGSYVGFVQWASVKHKVHPALKTIVPSVSAAPGLAEPMENGVHQNFHYSWHHYVSSNKYLDTVLYFNAKRWRDLNMKWYEKGIAYNAMDSLDGLPNPQFNERLSHPTYDKYWQDMMPYQEDFSHINIPVLATTGYYDGGQIGTIHYLKEHVRYNKNAEHYLVIGPYTHFGAQRKPEATILGYDIDPVAQIDVPALIFEWFDYILKGRTKPSLLKDKINYQVMGSNTWGHAPSLETMANDTLKFHLSNERSNVLFKSTYDSGNNGENNHYRLKQEPANSEGYLEQIVDFSDRSDLTWNSSVWSKIIDETLTVGQGFSFSSKPIESDFELNGSFLGELNVSINKKDFDCTVLLYEQTSDGKFFALTLPYVGRSSFVRNPEKRELLEPHVKTTIPFNKARVTSKKISKGSRIIVVLNVIKEPFSEINYGTGKDVSKETITDAIEPLLIKWYNDSYIQIPIKKN
ncbi:MAG: CocE/NonD family hydrolase [Bacteroidota bacterium]